MVEGSVLLKKFAFSKIRGIRRNQQALSLVCVAFLLFSCCMMSNVSLAYSTKQPAKFLPLSVVSAKVIHLFSLPASFVLSSHPLMTTSSGERVYLLVYTNPAVVNPMTDDKLTVSVLCDAKTGTVLSYQKTGLPSKPFQFPPQLSQTALTKIAWTWAHKLYPNQAGSTTLLPVTLTGQGPLVGAISYHFIFSRLVHHIVAPFNGFQFIIDSSGQLLFATDAWSSLAATHSSASLPLATANLRAMTDLGLKLAYVSVPSEKGNHWILGYEPSMVVKTGQSWAFPYAMPSSIFPVIDAKTGKMIDAMGSPIVHPTNTMKPIQPGGLTRLPGMPSSALTKAMALSLAKRFLGITTNERLILTKKTTDLTTQDTLMTFIFLDAKKAQASAVVDATRGYVVQATNFLDDQSAYPAALSHPNGTVTTRYNDALAFVKAQFPQSLGALGLSLTPSLYGNYPSIDYRIQPFVHGVPVQGDLADLVINPINGKMQSFTWRQPIVPSLFPSTQGAMALSQAGQRWLHQFPLTLNVVQTQGTTAQSRVGDRLAYVGSSPMTGIVLDAHSGNFVDTTSPINFAPYPGSIRDLSGIDGALQVQLLASRGFLYVDSQGDVHPSATMTQGQFLAVLMQALGTPALGKPLSAPMLQAMRDVAVTDVNYPYIALAYADGWLSPSTVFVPHQAVTRQFAALMLTYALDFTSFLKTPSLFSLTTTDAANVTGADRVAASIALSMHMLTPVQGAFAGKNTLTIAQAAIAIVQAAVLQGEDGTTHPSMTLIS